MPSTETFGIGVILDTATWIILFGEIKCCRTSLTYVVEHEPLRNVNGAARII